MVDLKNGTIQEFINFNKEYDNGKYLGSEVRKYDINAINTWLSVRDKLTYIEDYQSGKWTALQIVKSCSKYGTNYIYIDIENKKWRTKQTASEFYGNTPPRFNTL